MTMHSVNHLRIYGRYFVIGATVGILTILVREAVAVVLPEDSPPYYALSVSFAYTIGILMSYYGHRTFTFRHASPIGGTLVSFSRFTVIATIGFIVTTLLSVVIRYGLLLDTLFGKFGATCAFASAALIASVLTYSLNSSYTFIRARDKS